MPTIFHITSQEAWQQAMREGVYRTASLAAEGFIHCSEHEQVAETANRIFQGQKGLVLLEIEPEKLHAPLRYEASFEGQRFPHIYGPLNINAVISTHPLFPNSEGVFSF